MRILFAGTPKFAVPSLRVLHQSSHHIAGVLTQPDRPAGRGQHLTPSAVKTQALDLGLAVYQPQSLKNEDALTLINEIQPEAILVVAYGLFFPSQLLSMPNYGCVNLHPSLLPRWRGAAPIQNALWAGDEKTGVSIMQMGEGLDNGDILLQRELTISNEDTAGTLHDKLADLGSEALLAALDGLEHDSIHPRPQNNSLATYAHKITKADACIDWSQDAEVIERMIRALNPTPVAYTYYKGQRLRIWQAQALSARATRAPGVVESVDADGVTVAAGNGLLKLQKLQRPGSQPVSARDWLNAVTIVPGDQLGQIMESRRLEG